jgi:lactate dehydrogenase-like 2-hydroxyacid dehydrogenase
MSKPTVALVRAVPAAVEEALTQHFTVERLPDPDAANIAQALQTCDAIVPSVVDRVPRELIEATPRKTRIIANFGAGTDNIDLAAARAAGLTVTNTPGALTEDTADLALLLILAATRRADQASRELRAGAWTGWRPTHVFGSSLGGKTLGIVGYGRIGRAVARRARSLGMRVCWLNRSGAATEPSSDESQQLNSLEELLATSDVVSLHMPASAETKHLIDAKRLAQMKRGAVLVNTARGSLVDEQALVHALESGHLSAAGLDVFENEPHLSPELLRMTNVILLPHIGSATPETRMAMGMMVVDNLVAFFGGKEPPNRVV